MQLANTLHLETTAEGVEHAEQRDTLAELGCTHIQGYLYSKPMPGDETHDYLTRDHSRAGAESFVAAHRATGPDGLATLAPARTV